MVIFTDLLICLALQKSRSNRLFNMNIPSEPLSSPKLYVYTKMGRVLRRVCVVGYSRLFLMCVWSTPVPAQSLQQSLPLHILPPCSAHLSSCFSQFPLSSVLQFQITFLPWYTYVYQWLSFLFFSLSYRLCDARCRCRRMSQWIRHLLPPLPTPSFLFLCSAIRPALLHATCPWYP